MRKRLILELYTTTRMPAAAIAGLAGCSAQTVWNLVRAEGAKRPPKPAPSPKIKKSRVQFGSQRDSEQARTEQFRAQRAREKDRLMKLWNDGLDLDAIAIRFQTTRDGIKKRLRRLGIDPKASRRLRTVEEKLAIRGSHILRPGVADWQRRT